MAKHSSYAWIYFFAGAVLVFLLGTYAFIDWAGARRWKATQEMLIRDGESLDFRKHASPPIPDDQNFCAIPALKDVALYENTMGSSDPIAVKYKRLAAAGKVFEGLHGNSGGPYVPMPKGMAGASLGKPADMAAWQAWFIPKEMIPTDGASSDPAHEILSALSVNDALFDELAEGVKRPQSQWTPAWNTRPLKQPMGEMQISTAYFTMEIVKMLCLRAAAAVQAGEPGKANQSLLIASRLTEAQANELTLIQSIAAINGSAAVGNGVWELCNAQAGSDGDFRALEEALRGINLRQSLINGMRGEISLNADTFAYIKKNREYLSSTSRGGPSTSAKIIMNLAPDGWFDANAATAVRWCYDYCLKPLHAGNIRELLAKQDEFKAQMLSDKAHPFLHSDHLLVFAFIPSFQWVVYKQIYSQTLLNQAIVACALERYRINHHQYPNSIQDAVLPGEKDLPLDIISGKPMGYRKTPDGRYALWCVAFNGKDHGGVRALDSSNPSSSNFASPDYAGDWVWDFTGK